MAGRSVHSLVQDSGCRGQTVNDSNDHRLRNTTLIVVADETDSQPMNFYVRIKAVLFIRVWRGRHLLSFTEWELQMQEKNIAEGANSYKQRIEMLINSSNAGNNW